MQLKRSPCSHYHVKVEGKPQFKGSHCLHNCLLDVVYNLQINTLAQAKVLILSQHRANQAALD